MNQQLDGNGNGDPLNDEITDDDVIVPAGGNVTGHFTLKQPQNNAGLLTADIGATSTGGALSLDLKVLCLNGKDTQATKQDVLARGTSCLSTQNRNQPSFTEKDVRLGSKPKGQYFTIHAAIVWSDGTSEYLGHDTDITK